jgi:hypothetical protein
MGELRARRTLPFGETSPAFRRGTRRRAGSACARCPPGDRHGSQRVGRRDGSGERDGDRDGNGNGARARFGIGRLGVRRGLGRGGSCHRVGWLRGNRGRAQARTRARFRFRFRFGIGRLGVRWTLPFGGNSPAFGRGPACAGCPPLTRRSRRHRIGTWHGTGDRGRVGAWLLSGFRIAADRFGLGLGRGRGRGRGLRGFAVRRGELHHFWGQQGRGRECIRGARLRQRG